MAAMRFCPVFAVPAVRRSVSAALLLALGVSLTGCVVAPHRGYHRYPAQPPATVPVASTPLYFYPEQNQPEAIQDRDRYECYRWASAQTGTDPGMTPLRVPRAPEPLPPQRDGTDVVGGALTGAMVGAAVSRPRYAGENAAIGAVFGLILGAIAQESRAQAVERHQARQQASYQNALNAAQAPHDNFRRAMSACMQGRGYRVA